jgi:hypothetical protein
MHCLLLLSDGYLAFISNCSFTAVGATGLPHTVWHFCSFMLAQWSSPLLLAPFSLSTCTRLGLQLKKLFFFFFFFSNHFLIQVPHSLHRPPSMTAPFLRLPQELIERIAGYIYDPFRLTTELDQVRNATSPFNSATQSPQEGPESFLRTYQFGGQLQAPSPCSTADCIPQYQSNQLC